MKHINTARGSTAEISRELLEARVGDAGDVLDDDGLVHLVRDDDAEAGLAPGVGGGGIGLGVAHGVGSCV